MDKACKMVTQWLGATDRVVAGNETIARNDREHGKNSLDSIKCLRELKTERFLHRGAVTWHADAL